MRGLLTVFIFSNFAIGSSSANPSSALTLTAPPSGGISRPGSDTVHGWEFSVNSQVIVTHLGLFDDNGDGLGTEHPIGVFRIGDSQLLSSGVLSAGSSDTLVDSFRYVDTPDVVLEPGELYVVAFYSSQPLSDRLYAEVTPPISVHQLVNFVSEGRSAFLTGGLVLPTTIQPDSRIGPNFLFQVPEPSTIVLQISCCLGIVTFRGRRLLDAQSAI